MRWLLVAGLLASLAPRALAADDAVSGTWDGNYLCGQGDTALTLTLGPAGPKGEVSGLFHFNALKKNPGVPEGCFTMTGTYDRQSREVKLTAGRWLLWPWGYVSVNLEGRVGPDGRRLGGRVIGPFCTSFALRRTGPAPAVLPEACAGDATVAAVR